MHVLECIQWKSLGTFTATTGPLLAESLERPTASFSLEALQMLQFGGGAWLRLRCVPIRDRPDVQLNATMCPLCCQGDHSFDNVDQTSQSATNLGPPMTRVRSGPKGFGVTCVIRPKKDAETWSYFQPRLKSGAHGWRLNASRHCRNHDHDQILMWLKYAEPLPYKFAGVRPTWREKMVASCHRFMYEAPLQCDWKILRQLRHLKTTLHAFTNNRSVFAFVSI